MNRKKFNLIFSAILFALASCSEETYFEDINSEIPLTSCTSSFVSIEDVSRLISAREAKTRGENDTVFSITCITDENNDTLLYAIDKIEGGWILLSTDTRVPPVVGESDGGTFSEAILNKSRNAWIHDIVKDMRLIRNSPEEALNFTKSQINHNRLFWYSISNEDEYVKKYVRNTKATRAKPGDPIIIDYERFGHYELSNISIIDEDSICVERLTKTDWHQEYPYNSYCPYKSSGNFHAPAGCVAIAGVQILYFLATEKNYPIEAPSKAYVNWKVGDTVRDWDQYDFNHWIWGQMKKYESVSAPLIAYVGRKVNMGYTDEGSFAVTRDLVSDVFAPYGISCTFRSYDADIVEKSIYNEMPVILRASGETENGSDTGGHAFIADKFKRSRKKRTDTFRWVYDSMPQNPDGSLMLLPYVPDKEEISYLTDYVSMIGMNWGWGNEKGENNEWYSATQKWINNYSEGINWKNGRSMIYGFSME